MDNTTDERNLKFYRCYTPLQNALRYVPLLESLYVTWSYYRNISKDLSFRFPKDIEVLTKIVSPYASEDRVRMFTSEWELAILAREIIINAPLSVFTKETLRKASYFIKTFQKIRTIDNEMADIYDMEDIILQQVHRIMHQQFQWHGRYNNFHIYIELFTNPILSKYIENIFTIPINKLIFIGFGIFTQFLAGFCYSDFPLSKLPGVSKEDIQNILNKISKPVEELKNMLSDEHKLNEKFFVYKDALTSYPIIQFYENDRLFYACPIPQFILWRIFNGLYYDCIKNESFGKDFGMVFQNYLINRINIINVSNKFTVFKEEEYHKGRNRKDTIDIQVSDTTANLFIECKAKRLTQNAKEVLFNKEEIVKQIDVLMDAVVQGYKSILDYQNGYYSNTRTNNNPIYLLVVTLENWNLPIISTFIDIPQILNKKLLENHIPLKIIEKYPYIISSARECEELIHILAFHPILHVMKTSVREEASTSWRFLNYNQYSEFLKNNPMPQSTVLKDTVNTFTANLHSNLPKS